MFSAEEKKKFGIRRRFLWPGKPVAVMGLFGYDLLVILTFMMMVKL